MASIDASGKHNSTVDQTLHPTIALESRPTPTKAKLIHRVLLKYGWTSGAADSSGSRAVVGSTVYKFAPYPL